MKINKEYWHTFHLRMDDFPIICCPTCKDGNITPREKFNTARTANARKTFESEFSDQMDEETRFTGLLVCDNQDCQDVVSVSGISFYEPDDPSRYADTLNSQPLYLYYKPYFFNPPIEIIELKKNYPTKVKEILKLSFSLFFFDYESAGNKIRIALEELLTELGVPRYLRTGKRRKIVLHKRIETYKEQNPLLGELMLSIKWIGNYSSHSDSLQKSDILDAYELMQNVLDKLYDDNEKQLLKQARTINRTRKPLSKTANNNR